MSVVSVTGKHLFFTPLVMAITPNYLMHRLCANHHAYADNDYYHDRAQHHRKRRRVLAVLLAEVLRRREEWTQRQNMHCTYLTHSDLNPSPHIGTPWQHMHARGNDHAFITTMGIDVATFEYLLAQVLRSDFTLLRRHIGLHCFLIFTS